MQTKSSHFATSVLTRLKKALNVQTDAELSEILGVKPNTIASWKKRNTMDHLAIVAICEEHGLSLDSIFLNRPPKNYTIHNEQTESLLRGQLSLYERIDHLQSENGRLKDKIIHMLEKKSGGQR